MGILGSQSIPKVINFIWLGSAIPEDENTPPFYQDFWKNILSAKWKNSDFTLNLYIDSSVITPDELKRMEENCKKEAVVLVDIHNNQEIEAWFQYKLLRRIIEAGKKKNIKAYYANASDFLRLLIMIYKGGYYFDTDCSEFPNLEKLNDKSPPLGFWQLYSFQSDVGISKRSRLLPYHFQASVPFNFVYLWAVADIVRTYQALEEIVFGDDLTNPLLLHHHDKRSRMTTAITGISVYRALMIYSNHLKITWDTLLELIIFPQHEAVTHSGCGSYLVSECKFDNVDEKRKEFFLRFLGNVHSEFEVSKLEVDHWEKLYRNLISILPEELRKLFLIQDFIKLHIKKSVQVLESKPSFVTIAVISPVQEPVKRENPKNVCSIFFSKKAFTIAGAIAGAVCTGGIGGVIAGGMIGWVGKPVAETMRTSCFCKRNRM